MAINNAIETVLKMSKRDKAYISMGAVIDFIKTARVNFNEIDVKEVRYMDLLNLVSELSEFTEEVKELMYNGK